MSPLAHLRGTVAALGPDWVVIDVAGVGFRAWIPGGLAASLSLGQEATLHTHLLVREDGMSLYGFARDIDLEVFEQLISVSGVGPRAALALLSAMTAEELASAVVQSDVARLRGVPGIGEKTAGRLVIDLQAKLASLALAGDGAVPRTWSLRWWGWGTRRRRRPQPQPKRATRTGRSRSASGWRSPGSPGRSKRGHGYTGR